MQFAGPSPHSSAFASALPYLPDLIPHRNGPTDSGVERRSTLLCIAAGCMHTQYYSAAFWKVHVWPLCTGRTRYPPMSPQGCIQRVCSASLLLESRPWDAVPCFRVHSSSCG
ncbi:uncharacterized protein EI97DRAFT_288892 [Westerdykella ornata]|uniref:Uncharacterized protein n=1 Tax=Westerdykella ornata TaxID=318751 RepID=A0A6A6JNV0_WESOR|nr:uncharacterized protein EI97DRAFT_288892 [Westerdykella ornata]KAF2277356.1 hypothetical protein EI97DRAFT_288892 [Westerdykella ornata]